MEHLVHFFIPGTPEFILTAGLCGSLPFAPYLKARIGRVFRRQSGSNS